MSSPSGFKTHVKTSLLAFSALLLFTFLQSGCFHTKPRDIQDVRRKLVQTRISNEIVLSTWESRMAYWHPSSLRIDANNLVAYIDPVDLIDPVPADYIFITHSHGDHFLPTEMMKLVKPGTKIVFPKSMKIDLPECTPIPVEPGQTLTLGGMTCDIVPAFNLMHPRWSGFVGYVLTIGSIKIFHSGDTSHLPSINNITVALLPIGGITTFNPRQAAEAINVLKPDMVIPIHYNLRQHMAEDFQNAVTPSIAVQIMEEK